jgi:hypothetical protein
MNSLLARNVSKEYFSSGRVFYSFSKVGTVLVLEPSALGTPFLLAYLRVESLCRDGLLHHPPVLRGLVGWSDLARGADL